MNVFGLATGGLVGSLILLIGFKSFVYQMQIWNFRHILVILIGGSIIPALIMNMHGVEYGWDPLIEIKIFFPLWLIWNTFMFFMFSLAASKSQLVTPTTTKVIEE